MLLFRALLFFLLGAYAMATPVPTTSSEGKAGLSLVRRTPFFSAVQHSSLSQGELLARTKGYWWRRRSLVNITLLISPRMNLTCLDSQKGEIMWYIWTAKGLYDQLFLRRWMRRVMETRSKAKNSGIAYIVEISIRFVSTTIQTPRQLTKKFS